MILQQKITKNNKTKNNKTKQKPKNLMGYNRVTKFMKTNALITAAIVALLLTLGLTSCNKEKEGVFNPKYRIARIYMEVNGNKELSESYFWNTKGVERIEYVENNEVLKFEYNKNNQVTKVNAFRDDEVVYYADVTYKNGLYDDVVFHILGETEYLLTFSFTYSKKKMKTIKMTTPLMDIFSNLDEKSYPLLNRTMTLFMPAALPIETVIKSMNSKQEPSLNLEITYTFEWNGDNVAKMSAGTIDMSFSGYDKKLNPFQGFTVSKAFNPINLSKNNPAKLTYNFTDETSTINYAYTYDGDIPTKIITTISGDPFPVLSGNGLFSESTKYYEYNK
jgi:hypothetical protein